MDSITDQKLELARLKRLHSHILKTCYSAEDPDSLPTDSQQDFLEDINNVPVRWAVCDNRSGKSQAGAREAAWLFSDTHPFFKKPKEWGNGPILMLILGKKSEQMETALWNGKIRPLLGGARFREVRSGNALQKVINEDNGNTIIFQSHNNPEEARKNAQGYDAKWVWVDEMPESHRLISELVMRIVGDNGRIIGTFTPLVFNIAIRKMIDKAALPIAKRYHFSIYDNPKLADRIDEVIETIRQNCATEAEFQCRVGGKWMTAGQAVSCYDPTRDRVELPDYYDVTWRHVVGVDPAVSGKAGLTVWAEDPNNGTWYNVKAKCIQGDAAYILVGLVEEEIARYNIVKRICDPNPAGFYREAARRKIWYHTVSEKAGRKSSLIDNSNKCLLTGKMKLTEHSNELEDELTTCAWSETQEGRIINGSSYHNFDTMQYVADALPEYDPEVAKKRDHLQQVRYDWHQVKEKKEKKRQRQAYQIVTKNKRRGRFAALRNKRRSLHN